MHLPCVPSAVAVPQALRCLMLLALSLGLSLPYPVPCYAALPAALCFCLPCAALPCPVLAFVLLFCPALHVMLSSALLR